MGIYPLIQPGNWKKTSQFLDGVPTNMGSSTTTTDYPRVSSCIAMNSYPYELRLCMRLVYVHKLS